MLISSLIFFSLSFFFSLFCALNTINDFKALNHLRPFSVSVDFRSNCSFVHIIDIKLFWFFSSLGKDLKYFLKFSVPELPSLISTISSMLILLPCFAFNLVVFNFFSKIILEKLSTKRYSFNVKLEPEIRLNWIGTVNVSCSFSFPSFTFLIL